MTLEIHIVEYLSVQDVLEHVRGAVSRLISWIKAEDEEKPEEPTQEEGDNKSPPTLSVEVKEEVVTKERLS